VASRTRTFARWMGVALCGAGTWISAELVKEQAGPWPSSKHSPRLVSGLCGSSGDGESGCAAVLQSDWSAVDFNVPTVTRALTVQWTRVVVPVAFIGLAYFVFLGVWHTFAGPPQAWGRRWYLIPLLSVLAGTAGSAFLLWVMVFKLQAPCKWCLVTHAINGLLLVSTLCMWPSARRRTIRMTFDRSDPGYAPSVRARLTAAAALKVTGFAALVIAGLWVYRTAKLDIRREVGKLLPYKQFVRHLENDPDFLLREYYAEPRHFIPGGFADDEAQSKLVDPTVVIFSDFLCPHCACFASRWEQEFRRNWEGPLQVSFRHFPRCHECNDTVTAKGHPEACRASYASEAARSQGGEAAFWQMHDLLFKYSRRLGDRSYSALATRIGLDADKLVADMDSVAVREAVAADVALAAELGVKSTPTAFLEGRRVPRLCLNNPVFWEAIAAELSPGAAIAEHGTTDEAPDGLLLAYPIAATAQVDP